MAGKDRRNHGFDALRIFAAAAVVLLHSATTPVALHDPSNLAFLRMACRFAVPFFFIASGYFQRDVTRFNFALVTRPAKRLLPLYIFWTLIYDAIFYLKHDAATLRHYNYNVAFHLWFLPALGVGLVILQVGRAIFGLPLVTVLAFVLALIGLASTAYSGLLGYENSGQRGWLFAPLFLVIGAWLARMKYSPSLKVAISTIIIGYGCSMAEECLLAPSTSHSGFFNHAFLFSTFPFGLGVAFLALWLDKNSRSQIIFRLSALGSLTLGIYLSHLLCLWILAPLIEPNAFAGIATLAIMTFGASTVLAAALTKTPYLRRVAT